MIKKRERKKRRDLDGRQMEDPGTPNQVRQDRLWVKGA